MIIFAFQMLDCTANELEALPDDMSRLTNLKAIVLEDNNFAEPPVSILRHMTALNTIDLSFNCPCDGDEGFRIPSPLLPILHPGLTRLDFQQQYCGRPSVTSDPFQWDPMSLVHMGFAMAELAKRRPVPNLLYTR
jgi:hypothetical protein